MNDAWYFEIGDGKTYGPFPFEKLQKWASLGNLMPTHRVRQADSTDWIIAADVPGLEGTMSVTDPVGTDQPGGESSPSLGGSLGKFGRALTRRKKPNDEPRTKDRRSTSGTPATDASAPSPPKGTAAHTEQGGRTTQAATSTNATSICNEILQTAYARKASDIHVEPEETIAMIQLRVDGELETLRKCSKPLYTAIISRLKVLSGMDIAEKRAPQDGRFRFVPHPGGDPIDVRSASLPTTHGERITMRLLGVQTDQLTIQKLGLSESDEARFRAAMAQRQGLILVTGATGSGKSTTLYAAIRYLLANRPGKIITVEDPVEFDMVGVAQVEVDKSERVQFETVLRTVLRSDPDVIMIGEMRDFTSADIAMKAALTGHLVLSSLHTNSAVGAITRLLNFGIPAYLVATTVRICVGQQLVRRLCPNCRVPRVLTQAEAELMGRPTLAGETIYGPKGCAHCHFRGHAGRIGIYEVVSMDDELARHIVDGAQEADLVRLLRQRGYSSRADDGVAKLLAGDISLADLVAAALIVYISADPPPDRDADTGQSEQDDQ